MKITNRSRVGGNTKFDERQTMSEDNHKKRVYLKPTKAAAEMTDEELEAFAKLMYDRIMGTLPERKDGDEK